MFIFNLSTIICILILLLVNLLFSKKKLLIDKPYLSNHKDNHKKIIPLSGGIFFIISLLVLSNINNIRLDNIIYLLPFLILGIFADTTKNFSPKLRLFTQLFFIIIVVHFLKVTISSIDLDFFDNLLKIYLFNFFFVTFCIITVLNGHNLMDGLNGFVSGNFLMILFSILIIIDSNGFFIDNNFNKKIEILIIISLIFFVFNFFGLCFMGDNGIYVFSIFISLLVINFVYHFEDEVSPIIAASFLWYPAYENLYSILRRLKKKKIISDPDKLHLHILFKDYLKLKFGKKIKNTYLNSISGILMNFFLLPNFILSIYWYNSSIKLFYLIIFQIIIYMIAYIKLFKKTI